MKKHCYLFVYGFACALLYKSEHNSVAEATRAVTSGFGATYIIMDDNRQIIKKGFKP